MNNKLLNPLNALPYFTIEAVRQLLVGEQLSAGSVLTTLYRWMKLGEIIQIKKGVYMTRRFYELHRVDADFAPAVSAILIPQSYLSLEFVLQRNAILSEVTYPITALTRKQTRVFVNKLGTFTYRNIKESLYTGFTMSEYMGIPFYQATLAKALFDFLYLRPWAGNGLGDEYNLADDLRLNLEEFADKDRREFIEFVELSKSRKMARILDNLRKNPWRP